MITVDHAVLADLHTRLRDLVRDLDAVDAHILEVIADQVEIEQAATTVQPRPEPTPIEEPLYSDACRHCHGTGKEPHTTDTTLRLRPPKQETRR